jgi:O-antigen chain-terminating methyltransferase
MSIPFYRAFEDRHRGSRELIRERQEVYFPFIEPLKALYVDCKAIDLGCGRGEWLEILKQTGFDPLGVDLDRGMLDACLELGLPVELGDALSALKNLPDDSQALVSGFHIAEHIPFEDLKILVAEALRVLKPAGLLILETPNAENLIVGAQNFYLDPTHERPIPHLLLSFLTEFTGFKRTKLMRLHEPSSLSEGGAVDLMGVLGGTSPDYAIVAQKEARQEQLDQFNDAFDKHYGLALDALAQRYDAQIEMRNHQLHNQTAEMLKGLDQVNNRLEHTERMNQELVIRLNDLSNRCNASDASLQVRLEELTNRSASAEARLNEIDNTANQFSQERLADAVRLQLADQQIEDLKKKLDESLNNAHYWWLQATAHEARITAFLKSTSWRITWPLRAGMTGIYHVVTVPKRTAKIVFRPLLVSLLRFTVGRPVLRQRLKRVLGAWPGLQSRLETIARHAGILPPLNSSSEHAATGPVASLASSPESLQKLSPSARYVYTELKKAMNSKGPR